MKLSLYLLISISFLILYRVYVCVCVRARALEWKREEKERDICFQLHSRPVPPLFSFPAFQQLPVLLIPIC